MVVMIMALTMRRMMIMMVIMTTLWQGTHSTKVNCKQGNAIPRHSWPGHERRLRIAIVVVVVVVVVALRCRRLG